METENINELYKIAGELFNTGKFTEALSYYYRILALDVNSSNANYNVGTVCGLLGDIELAVAFYKRALRLNETNIRAMCNLASVYVYNLKDYDMASKYLDYAIKIAPNDPEIHNIYGNIYLFKEDFKKAELHLKKAIFNDENYPQNHYDMARALIGLNKKSKAKEELNKCLELAPKFKPARDLLNSL